MDVILMDVILNVGAHGVRPSKETDNLLRAQALRPFGIPETTTFNSTNP